MIDTLRRRMETARVAYQQAAQLPASMTDPRRVAVLRDAWLAACAEHAAEAIRKQGEE